MEIEKSIFNNIEVWHKLSDHNYYHREDGPAYIRYINNKHKDECWYYHNKRYFTDKNLLRRMPLNLFLAYCKWEYKKNGN